MTINRQDALKQRRSIRRYKEKPLEAADIKKILEADQWAPSGLNNQPWKFPVIEDKEKRGWLPGFTKYGRIIKEAPVSICVFLDNGASYNRDKGCDGGGGLHTEHAPCRI